MKNKDTKFLLSCNDDKHNQLCCNDEYKIAKRLKKKGYIKKIEFDLFDNVATNQGDFFIWLSKKGIKKVKELYIELDINNKIL